MDLRYIELKTGYHDDGPAWIGNVRESKSGRTLYFNDHGFQRHNGMQGNYIDVESGEEYWVSGIKKDGTDRHWAGRGPVVIDRKAVDEYLRLTGMTRLSESRFIVQDIPDVFPVDRIRNLLNQPQ